jgi:hypothetical protein
MLLGAGAYFTGIGLLAGDRVSLDVGALERGDPPGGRWAEVTGRLVADDVVSVAERRSGSAKVYIPLVSPEWRPGQPVRVYLKTFESSLVRNADDLASGLYDGMLAVARKFPSYLAGHGALVTYALLTGCKRPAEGDSTVDGERELPRRRLERQLGVRYVLGTEGLRRIVLTVGVALLATYGSLRRTQLQMVEELPGLFPLALRRREGVEVADVRGQRDALIAQVGEEREGVLQPVVGQPVRVVGEIHAGSICRPRSTSRPSGRCRGP